MKLILSCAMAVAWLQALLPVRPAAAEESPIEVASRAFQKGDYVLSWRWDCEQTPQIWNTCADLTVV